jgi:hypothetical protein
MSYLNTNFTQLIKIAEADEKDKKKKKRPSKGTSKDTSFTFGQLTPAGRAAFVAGRSPEEQNEAAANAVKITGGSLLGAVLGAGTGLGSSILLNKAIEADSDAAKRNAIIGAVAGTLLGGTAGKLLTYKTMMKNRGLDPSVSPRHLFSTAARTEALLGGDEASQKRALKRAIGRNLGWQLPGNMIVGAATGLTGGTAGALAAPLTMLNGMAAARLQRGANPEDYED